MSARKKIEGLSHRTRASTASTKNGADKRDSREIRSTSKASRLSSKATSKGKDLVKQNAPKTSKVSCQSEESGSEDSEDIPIVRQTRNIKYFAENCLLSNATRTKTSDHTLSMLKEKKIDFSDLHSILETAEQSHPKESQFLMKDHESNFEKWLLLMHEGFNIILYGVGSKYILLNKFVEEKLKEKASIVINGFFPGLTIKQVLNSITEEVINHPGSFSNLHDQAEFICQNLHKDLYLIIHNMDGSMLNTDKPISALCHLAKCKKIHFISTVDHVNCGLIWNTFQASCFRFLWFDVTSFERYKVENAYENSFLMKQSNVLALSSLHHVFRSLTPNAQGIFLLLAKKQLEQSEQNGLSFKELFRECREAFLVNSDLTLRTQLTEFKDHNMVRLRKGHDGIEYLQVAVDAYTLKEFLEQHE